MPEVLSPGCFGTLLESVWSEGAEARFCSKTKWLTIGPAKICLDFVSASGVNGQLCVSGGTIDRVDGTIAILGSSDGRALGMRCRVAVWEFGNSLAIRIEDIYPHLAVAA